MKAVNRFLSQVAAVIASALLTMFMVSGESQAGSHDSEYSAATQASSSREEAQEKTH